MIETLTHPVVLSAVVAAISGLCVHYLNKRRTPAQAAHTLTEVANSLVEQYRADNIALRERVDALQARLDECEKKHREAEKEIDELQTRIEKLERIVSKQ